MVGVTVISSVTTGSGVVVTSDVGVTSGVITGVSSDMGASVTSCAITDIGAIKEFKSNDTPEINENSLRYLSFGIIKWSS
jgi:hypothetical protein